MQVRGFCTLMGNKGLGAHRGNRGRDSRPATATKAEAKKAAKPKNAVEDFRVAAGKSGWTESASEMHLSVPTGFQRGERYLAFTRGDEKITVQFHTSGRVASAHLRSGSQTVDDVNGGENQRGRVRKWFKK